MSWLEIKNLVCLKCLILCNNNEPFLNWIVTQEKKWVVRNNRWQPAQWLDQEEAPKTLPKVKPAPKKMSWSVFGGASLFHYSFLESWWNHYMWEVCSADRWDGMKTAMPAVSIGQQNGPNSSPGQRPTACHTTNASKVEWNSLQSFASSAVFTWPLANYHFFKHLNNLLQGKCSHNQQEAKNGYSKSLSNPKAQIFMLQEQTNLFLVGKNVLIVIDPIFDYKTVFEPSYNDLKFLVWNCNYFFTNLIEGRNLRSIIGSESEFPGDTTSLIAKEGPDCTLYAPGRYPGTGYT